MFRPVAVPRHVAVWLSLCLLAALSGPEALAQNRPAKTQITPWQFFPIVEPITSETVAGLRASTRQVIDRRVAIPHGPRFFSPAEWQRVHRSTRTGRILVSKNSSPRSSASDGPVQQKTPTNRKRMEPVRAIGHTIRDRGSGGVQGSREGEWQDGNKV